MGAALLSVVEVGVMDNYMDDVAYQLMDAVGEERTLLSPAVVQNDETKNVWVCWTTT